jgi:diamine N-acetyltransferase
MSLYLKKVTDNEVLQLQSIGLKTFTETFSKINTKENMDKYLSEKFSLEQLISEINNQFSEFYFALLENKIVGYLKINFGLSQTEVKDDKSLEIERIYVLNEFHSNKIGQFLFEKALQIAQNKNKDYIWLGVWEENYKALNFYKKNGFLEFDKHIFRLGNDEQTDLLLKLNLK